MTNRRHSPSRTEESLRRTRNLAFVALLVSAAVVGAAIGATGGDTDGSGDWALLALPAYVWWIRSDLALRGKEGAESWLLTLLSLVPGLGLLLYLLFTIRRASAVILWVGLCVALWLPATLAGVLARAIYAVATIEPF